MCGRFTLRVPTTELIELFALHSAVELEPRYNIAPTQPVACVRDVEGARVLSLLRWGLIPFWARDRSVGARMINARAETVDTKPAFREAFVRRRCLIPADGFFEWKKLGPRKKQPYLIRLRGDEPFAFAGLWERWRDRETQETVESCTIVTGEPNSLVAPLHDRMPMILPESLWQDWIDPRVRQAPRLLEMLRVFPEEHMEVLPVDPIVGNPRNDTPQCISPVPVEAAE